VGLFFGTFTWWLIDNEWPKVRVRVRDRVRVRLRVKIRVILLPNE
jgi:hypothetical protein